MIFLKTISLKRLTNCAGTKVVVEINLKGNSVMYELRPSGDNDI